MYKFLEAPGEICNKKDLQCHKAIELYMFLTSNQVPFVTFIECRKIQDIYNIIVFNIEIELGQITKNDIQKIEQIAVVFDNEDKKNPDILALRDNFPQVPHLFLNEEEFPRSLCVFEEDYNELKLHWTPIFFIESIRNWLALTARDQLHQDNQPLEWLMYHPYAHFIIPYDLFDNKEKNPLLYVFGLESENKRVLIGEKLEFTSKENKDFSYIALPIYCPPVLHGIIKKSPDSLFELHQFFNNEKFYLLNFLRNQLKEWLQTKSIPNILNMKLIIILFIPKKRYENSNEPETVENWAFLFNKTISDIGCEIGIYQKYNGNIGLVINIDQNLNGNKTIIYPLNIIFTLSRDNAAKFNGLSKTNKVKIAAIGLGALGSHVFINLIRAGFGDWVLIDNDNIFPHNLTRHALFGNAIGLSKVQSLSLLANITIDGEPISKYYNENILSLKNNKEEILNTLKESELILDMSTSIAVTRFLAKDINSEARRVALFINPSGTDLVLLAEDKNRNITLDMVEMQYYKFIINSDIKEHLNKNKNSYRYANSCRDLSFVISQDAVALLSAIGSKAIKSINENNNSVIKIWKTQMIDFTVTCLKKIANRMEEIKLGNWTIYMDQEFLVKIFSLRKEKLPNETGGVLIGAHDLQRKIIYIIETESPIDSIEWPTVYIRGCKKLIQRIKEINDYTLGMVGYIGEWHSHPNGFSILPSQDDRNAFQSLTKHMNIDGLPALMIIVGDNDKCGIYLETMDSIIH